MTERFRQSNGRIGGNGPRSLEILLIHHDFRRLAPTVLPVMPIPGLWFRRAAGARGGHLGGNCRERQPLPSGLWLRDTVDATGRHPVRRFDPHQNAIVMIAGGGAVASGLILRKRTGCRRSYFLFRLSALSAPTHNRCNNEDGLQCRTFTGRMWRV